MKRETSTKKVGIVCQIDRMGPRQREMLRVICNGGGATVREIHARIPDPPDSICGLRTQLNRLVKRGLLKTRRSGCHSALIYLPAESWDEVQNCAFQRLVIEHFEGSARQAVHELMRLAASEHLARNQSPDPIILRGHLGNS